jgi:hypothetical protein
MCGSLRWRTQSKHIPQLVIGTPECHCIPRGKAVGLVEGMATAAGKAGAGGSAASAAGAGGSVDSAAAIRLGGRYIPCSRNDTQ